jgi:hypothetical protein
LGASDSSKAKERFEDRTEKGNNVSSRNDRSSRSPNGIPTARPRLFLFKPDLFAPDTGHIWGLVRHPRPPNVPPLSSDRIRKQGGSRQRRASPWYFTTGERGAAVVTTRRGRLLQRLVWRRPLCDRWHEFSEDLLAKPSNSVSHGLPNDGLKPSVDIADTGVSVHVELSDIELDLKVWFSGR